MLETNRLAVCWLQVCAICLFRSSPVEFLALFIYALPRQTPPTTPPLPPHPFFSKTDTGSEFKIDTQCKCHFPAWLSLRQLSPPTPANQNPEASHVWVALSPVHTGRGGWSPPSAVSPPLVSAASLPPQPLPHPFPVDLGSFCLFFHWCSQGRSWLPALPPRVLSVAIFCHFPSLPVATLRARALSGACNAGETQTEFKCASFFLSMNLSPFSISQALSVSPLLFFISILYLSVCPCCLLSLCCPLLRRWARAHAISFAASVQMLTVKFKRNELKLSSVLKSVGGTLRRTIQSHSEMGF